MVRVDLWVLGVVLWNVQFVQIMFVLLPDFEENQGTARLREETCFVGCRDFNRLCLAVVVSVLETFPHVFFFLWHVEGHFCLILCTSGDLSSLRPGAACHLHGFVVFFIKLLSFGHGSIEMVSDFISTCSILLHVRMSHYLLQSCPLRWICASHIPDQVEEIFFEYNLPFSHRSDRILLQLFVEDVSALSERKLGSSKQEKDRTQGKDIHRLAFIRRMARNLGCHVVDGADRRHHRLFVLAAAQLV